MPDIETRLLRAFVSVANRASFAAAAENQECSAGAMSQRIRTLESRLGVRLFDRDRNGARLTADGRELLPDARAILDLHDRLLGCAARADPADTLAGDRR